jgi:hypothetical protein
MPGTRLGPVAEWIDVLRAPVEPAPATPPAPAPAEPATTTTATWWAALVVPAPAVEAERRTSWPPPRRSQPVDVHATPAPTQPSPLPPPAPPAGPVAAPGGDGLARRVPGTHLAPALRRDAGADGDADAATQGGSRDVERVRAMLSRFQSSQHAGRVAADPPPRRPPEENR